MRRIRVNQDVDCVVRVRAKVNGQPVLLEEERVSVVLVRPDASREDAEITGVDGDAVRLHLGHELLTQTGIYRLEVWLNRGGRNQMIGDRPAAFQLVPLSTQACDVADVYELGEVDMDFINPFVGVVDNLDSASDADALSARQGGVLKRMIEESALKSGDGLVMRNGALHVSTGVGIEVGSGHVSVKIDSSTGLGFSLNNEEVAINLDTVTLCTEWNYSLHRNCVKVRIDSAYKMNSITENDKGIAVYLDDAQFYAPASSGNRVKLKIGSTLMVGSHGIELKVGTNTPIAYNPDRQVVGLNLCRGLETIFEPRSEKTLLNVKVSTDNTNAISFDLDALIVRVGTGISLDQKNRVFLSFGEGLYVGEGNMIRVNVGEMKRLLGLNTEA